MHVDQKLYADEEKLSRADWWLAASQLVGFITIIIREICQTGRDLCFVKCQQRTKKHAQCSVDVSKLFLIKVDVQQGSVLPALLSIAVMTR